MIWSSCTTLTHISGFTTQGRYIPLDRYLSPFAPVMIAVTGFDDREMINAALRYRYIVGLADVREAPPGLAMQSVGG